MGDVLEFRGQLLLLLGKLQRLRVEFLGEGDFTLIEPRNFGRRCFRLRRGCVALSLKGGVLPGLFVGLFRQAGNALGQPRDFLPSRFGFGGSGLVVGIQLVRPAPQRDALLLEPGDLRLSLGERLRIGSANCRPGISSEHNAQSDRQHADADENYDLHLVCLALYCAFCDLFTRHRRQGAFVLGHGAPRPGVLSRDRIIGARVIWLDMAGLMNGKGL